MSDPTTPEGRAELRKLLAQAGPKTWVYLEDADDPDDCGIYAKQEGSRVVSELSEWRGVSDDAELLVAAVNALPALLDALDNAYEQRDLVKDIATWEHNASVARLARARAAEAALDRVRALADDMETWCSPYGVAVDYAKRIHEALDGAQ